MYLAVYDQVSRKRLAFLENAYNIGYTLNLSILSEATFTLPLSDPKNQYCIPYRWVEFWDENDFVGMFRILPSEQTKNADTREIVYTCEHVLATLMDDVLIGWHEIGNIGVYTSEVLSYVLNAQTVPRWQLRSCDFTHQYLYGWENENLLSALFSVPAAFVEAYKWETNTSVYPWQLSLSAVSESPVAEIRYRKNLRGMTKSTDPTTLCTRLYAYGYGEGVNALNIANLNGGKLYLDADTKDTYGIISRVWVDQRYQDEISLYDAAVAQLKALSVPYISYTVEAAQNDELRKCQVGDYVRVIDEEDGTNFTAQVVTISKKDVVGDNRSVEITIANKPKDVASTVSDLADRARINETYAQGAVTVYTKTFADNADTDHPAEIIFDIPSNIVHINEVTLNAKTAPFRGYSKAVEGGGEYSDTTESGGGETTTTSSGGGSVVTSEEVVLESRNINADSSYTSGSQVHNHGISKGTRLAVVNGFGDFTIVDDVGWTPSGAHEHEAHSHEVEIDSHRHSVSIESHTHEVMLPNHTHAIEYGIYEGNKAEAMQIFVDDTEAGIFESVNNLNIVPYLGKNDDGTITRGQHTVTVYPIDYGSNGQQQSYTTSRIELDIMIQLFANSRGGGQY